MTTFLFQIQYLWMLLNCDYKAKEITKWLANGFITISAIAISVSVPAADHAFTYTGFFLAHLIWGILAYIQRDKGLVGLFVLLVPIDLYAMYIRL